MVLSGRTQALCIGLGIGLSKSNIGRSHQPANTPPLAVDGHASKSLLGVLFQLLELGQQLVSSLALFHQLALVALIDGFQAT